MMSRVRKFSKDTKVICILVTTVWKKGNMIVKGFMTCKKIQNNHWMRKNVTVAFYIQCYAAVRDKYI